MSNERLKERFQEMLEKQASDELIDLKLYSRDASTQKGEAVLVIWPKDTEDLSKIIRLANLRGYQLTIRGAGCGVSGAAVPHNSIVVDVSSMNRIVELDRAESTVVVEPGVNVRDLNSILSKLNLWFPIEPFDHAVCTVGGMAATDCSGRYSYKFGKMSEWIANVEFMDGSGKQLKSEKLSNVVGREGATGIMTKIKLRLTQPYPTTTMTHMQFANAEEMFLSAANIRTEENVLAIEYIDKLSSQLLKWEDKHHIIIEYSDDKGEIKDQNEIKRVWRIYSSLAMIWKTHGYTHDADPKLSFEAVDEFLKYTRKAGIPTLGSIGKGIMHCLVRQDEGSLNEFYSNVRKLNGSISDGFGIGQLKKLYASSAYMEFIKALKRQYDPNLIINRQNI